MFRINPASGKAIYEQIMEQVKEAAWKGYLKPGDALPSVRKLALSLSVTPNTVAKAYQLLEKEKVIGISLTLTRKGSIFGRECFTRGRQRKDARDQDKFKRDIK